MLWRALAFLVVSLVHPGTALAEIPPWCGADRLNDSERMICVDEILGRLDLELNEVHAAARRVRPDLDQSGWLAERDRCGPRVLCLENAYRSRIAELREIAWGPAPAPAAAEAAQQHREDAALMDEALGDLALHSALAALDAMTPRPWCSGARLNPTERAICSDRNLTRLDALMDLAYGRTTAREGDRAQQRWLRGERDACGSDRLCIARAYSARIDQLNAASVDPMLELGIPPGQYPPPGSCRVWYLDRPPGRQPPPSSCNVRVPAGAVLLRG